MRAWGLCFPTCKQQGLTNELVMTLGGSWLRILSGDRSHAGPADERRGHVGEAPQGIAKT